MKVASRHRHSGIPFEDLVSEGNIGLLKAAERFDTSKGVKFSTYATYWIRQSILRALDSKSRTVRLPWQSQAKLRRIESARNSLRESFGREPDDTELSASSGVSLKTLKTLSLSCHCSTLSLDAKTPDDSEGRQTALSCSIPEPGCGPDSLLARKDSAEFFKKALLSLDSREAAIIRLRFGIDGVKKPSSCESIGLRLGLSREGVRKIQEKSLLKLRRMLLPEFDPASDEIAV